MLGPERPPGRHGQMEVSRCSTTLPSSPTAGVAPSSSPGSPSLVVAVTLGGRFGGDDTTDYGTPGSESSAANDLVADRFPAGSGDTINVVWRAPDVTAPAVQARVRDVLDRAAALDHVIGVVQGPTSDDGTVGYATLQLDTWDMPVEVTNELARARRRGRRRRVHRRRRRQPGADRRTGRGRAAKASG